MALVLATAPPRWAFALLRLFVVGFYFHSALTKLDDTFLHTLGQQFLATLTGLVGISPSNWSEGARLAAAAVFPVGELLVAVGLVLVPTRRFALAGAILLHVLLLVILGPLGLGHKPGVLLWNAYFIVQDLLLFGTARAAPAREPPPAGEPVPRFAAALVAVSLLLPLLEPWSWFDTWPSWGLYAPSAERVALQVHRRQRADLPLALEPFVEVPADDSDPWLTVRLDRWALAALGAPIYPQNRSQLGVAQAVIERCRLSDRGRAVRFGLADRFTGRREHSIVQGAAQWQLVADEYFLNIRPRPNWHASDDNP